MLAGGGASAWFVRVMLADIAKRLEKIENALDLSDEKQDERHVATLREIVKVEGKADAAHRRLDEFERKITS